jgi:hypothetical protein
MKKGRGGQKPAVTGEQGGRFLAEMAAALAPGAGLADASGMYYSPTRGERVPGLLENAQEGNYGTSAMQGLGLLGDATYAGGPIAGGILGSVLKFPGAVGKGMRAASKAGDVTPIRPPTTRAEMSPEDAAYWIENNRGLPKEMLDEAIRANPEAWAALQRQPVDDFARMSQEERRSFLLRQASDKRMAEEALARGQDQSMIGHMNMRSPAEEQAAQIAHAFKDARPGDAMNLGAYRLEYTTMPAGNPMVLVTDAATGKGVGSMHPQDVERYMTMIIGRR